MEISVGIISSCMPVTFVLFKGIFQKMRIRMFTWPYIRLWKRHDAMPSNDDVLPLPAQNVQLPQVPGGTLRTLRSKIRNVFKSSIGKSTTGGDSVTLTNMSDFAAGEDEYHAHLQDLETTRPI